MVNSSKGCDDNSANVAFAADVTNEKDYHLETGEQRRDGTFYGYAAMRMTATRDIDQGEELRFYYDYKSDYDESSTELFLINDRPIPPRGTKRKITPMPITAIAAAMTSLNVAFPSLIHVAHGTTNRGA